MPLLEELDGVNKISEFLDNYIDVTEDAKSMVMLVVSH